MCAGYTVRLESRRAASSPLTFSPGGLSLPILDRRPLIQLQIHHQSCYLILECLVVFYEDHCWLIFPQKVFDLHTGEYVDEVHGFVPDEQVGGLAEAFGEQDFLFLALAVFFYVFFELDSAEIQFSQECFKYGFIQVPLRGKISEASF